MRSRKSPVFFLDTSVDQGRSRQHDDLRTKSRPCISALTNSCEQLDKRFCHCPNQITVDQTHVETSAIHPEVAPVQFSVYSKLLTHNQNNRSCCQLTNHNRESQWLGCGPAWQKHQLSPVGRLNNSFSHRHRRCTTYQAAFLWVSHS